MAKRKNKIEIEKAKPKVGISKKWIAILVLGLIVVVVGGLFFLPAPTGEVALNEKNSEIYSLLVAGGINESMVDATPQRVLIQYDLPEELDKEASWYFAMGAAAAASPESQKIIVQALVNGDATEKVSVKTKDVLDFLARNITDLEFVGKFEFIA